MEFARMHLFYIAWICLPVVLSLIEPGGRLQLVLAQLFAPPCRASIVDDGRIFFAVAMLPDKPVPN